MENAVHQDLTRRILRAVSALRIILFGSSVRGDAGPDSDIDLIVVIPEGEHRRQAAWRIRENLRGFGRAVDLVVAWPSTLERLKNEPGLIYREALNEGWELHVET